MITTITTFRYYSHHYRDEGDQLGVISPWEIDPATCSSSLLLDTSSLFSSSSSSSFFSFSFFFLFLVLISFSFFFFFDVPTSCSSSFFLLFFLLLCFYIFSFCREREDDLLSYNTT